MSDKDYIYKAIENAKDKLQLYREVHSGNYMGGVEYTTLMQVLDEAQKRAVKLEDSSEKQQMLNVMFKDAFELWGEDLQLTLLAEELAELIVIVSRFKRGRGSIDALVEEVADVEVTLAQLKWMIGEEMVSKMGTIKEQKLARLQSRTQEELQRRAQTNKNNV